MKTVNFLGQDWEVPDWANYITRDRDGSVYFWLSKPKLEEGIYVNYDTKYDYLGYVPVEEEIQKID